jgi:hypothetical protein
VIAFCFDIRVRYLVIEELPAFWAAVDTPSVVIEQPTEEPKTIIPLKSLNLYEVGQLPHEAADTLLKAKQVCLDLFS